MDNVSPPGRPCGPRAKQDKCHVTSVGVWRASPDPAARAQATCSCRWTDKATYRGDDLTAIAHATAAAMLHSRATGHRIARPLVQPRLGPARTRPQWLTGCVMCSLADPPLLHLHTDTTLGDLDVFDLPGGLEANIGDHGFGLAELDRLIAALQLARDYLARNGGAR